MATKLSDMQLVLLATACQRDDGSLLPPPDSIADQPDRIRQGMMGLIRRKLVSAIDVNDAARTWREEKDRRIGLAINDAGRALIGLPAGKGEAADVANGATSPAVLPSPVESDKQPGPAAEVTLPEQVSPAPRLGTKQGLVLDLLRRDGGASIDDLTVATGWLPHTTRAALTGLRKKGHAIDRTKQGEVSVYHIGGAA